MREEALIKLTSRKTAYPIFYEMCIRDRCSVIRWEKTTRPFLRSREFWWQEGHTIHETAEEARAETEQQLKCYADFFENVLAIPVVPGRKTEKEKFAGAEATYTVECMMKDRKALQGATSHYFGDKFSRAYNVTFTGRDNKLQYPFQTLSLIHI